MSGQLSKHLYDPLLATLSLYLVSASILLVVLGLRGRYPAFETLNSVPFHLWFLGSVFSVLALSTVYWLLPQRGVAPVMSGVVGGQVLVAMVASHWGGFELPVDRLTWYKATGALLLVLGVLMMNGVKPHVSQ